MSQPVALIARIPLTEEAFKKFLRSKAARLLIDCVADELIRPSQAYMVFRYLKPEQALFAFFYFNHGNAELLQASREWQALQQLATHATGSQGFVLHSLDALNLFDDIAAAYQVVDGRCVETPMARLQGLDTPKFLKDCQKYFFAATEVDFALQVERSRVVDKSIARRARERVEEYRIEQLASKLHLASFVEPMYLFGDYFFNGQFVYHRGGDTTPLPGIDAGSFRPAAWGGIDTHHAVVLAEVLPVDVASFEMLQKGETRFYKDRSQVFSANFHGRAHGDPWLQRLPQADAPSFKLHGDFLAEDARHLYFCGQTVPRGEVGAFHVEAAGYFHALKLLVGEHAVYLGKDRLPLDPASFRLEHDVEVPDTGAAFSNAYVVRDAGGRYLLYREGVASGRMGAVRLAPVADLAAAKALISQMVREAQEARERNWALNERPRLAAAQGPDDPAVLRAYVDQFERWMDAHFEAEYARDRFDPFSSMLYGINNYFYALFHLGRPADVIAFYPRIQAVAWFNPHIFHHTACSYAALGRLDEALQEVRRAVAYRYPHADKLWQDPDLSALHAHPDFQAMAARAEPRVSTELLDAILALPPSDRDRSNDSHGSFLRGLALGIPFLPDPQDAVRDRKLRQVFARYLNHHVVEPTAPMHYARNSPRRGDFYSAYRDHPYLHPLAHWKRFKGIYSDAHFYSNKVKSADIAAAVQSLLPTLKAALSAAEAAGDVEVLADIESERECSGLFRHVMAQG